MMVITPMRRMLIGVLVGGFLILINRWFGIELSGVEPMLVDTVVAVLTAVVAESIPDTQVDNPDEEGDDDAAGTN